MRDAGRLGPCAAGAALDRRGDRGRTRAVPGAVAAPRRDRGSCGEVRPDRAGDRRCSTAAGGPERRGGFGRGACEQSVIARARRPLAERRAPPSAPQRDAHARDPPAPRSQPRRPARDPRKRRPTPPARPTHGGRRAPRRSRVGSRGSARRPVTRPRPGRQPPAPRPPRPLHGSRRARRATALMPGAAGSRQGWRPDVAPGPSPLPSSSGPSSPYLCPLRGPTRGAVGAALRWPASTVLLELDPPLSRRWRARGCARGGGRGGFTARGHPLDRVRPGAAAAAHRRRGAPVRIGRVRRALPVRGPARGKRAPRGSQRPGLCTGPASRRSWRDPWIIRRASTRAARRSTAGQESTVHRSRNLGARRKGPCPRTRSSAGVDPRPTGAIPAASRGRNGLHLHPGVSAFGGCHNGGAQKDSLRERVTHGWSPRIAGRRTSVCSLTALGAQGTSDWPLHLPAYDQVRPHTRRLTAPAMTACCHSPRAIASGPSHCLPPTLCRVGPDAFRVRGRNARGCAPSCAGHGPYRGPVFSNHPDGRAAEADVSPSPCRPTVVAQSRTDGASSLVSGPAGHARGCGG
jgi:hypothetical protein